MEKIILVTGGNIGDIVARHLAEQGKNVRLLVRQRSPNPILDLLGVVQVEADLTRPETLPPVFEGVERYFSVTPLVENLVELGLNALKAAKEAGVGLIVRSSARGAAENAITVGRWHWQVEKGIEESGLDFTILQPASFFQNYLFSADSIREQHTFYAATGEGKAALIDVRDIAAVVVMALTQGGHTGKRYELTGGELLNSDEVAGQFSDLLGRTITCVNRSDAESRRAMRERGTPAWMVDAYAELDWITRQGYVASVSPDFVVLTGRRPITFRQFLRDNAAVFSSDRSPIIDAV